MSVTAPPRPPRRRDPVDRGYVEDRVKALIEEAKRRARRRRLVYATAVTSAALAGIAAFTVYGRTAHSQTAASAPVARPSLAAGAGRSQIAFTREPDEIHVMNPDGSGQRLLAREAGKLDLNKIAWSPDGREIAYGGAFARGGVLLVRADGSGVRKLTLDGYGFDWAPDGRMIAFTTVRGGYRDIHVVNSDGRGERRLAKRGLGPHWSPDGRKIAFASRRDGNWEIYVANADGSGQRNLTRNPAADGSPVWSPDGRTIFFWRFPGRSQGIWVMNADGSGQRKWAPDFSPVWSPDGRKVAFVRRGDIWVMNADGSRQRQLTRYPSWDGSPTWSPDGRKIAFIHSRNQSSQDVYVANADGSGQQRLARNAFSVAWSPAQRRK